MVNRGKKYSNLDLYSASSRSASKALPLSTSSSRMRVIFHNWSATKQRPHPQSVAEISRHSVLSGDRIRQCETSSGSRHKDTDQCLIVAISFCRHRRSPLASPFSITLRDHRYRLVYHAICLFTLPDFVGYSLQPAMEGRLRLSRPEWLVLCRGGLPIHRWLPT